MPEEQHEEAAGAGQQRELPGHIAALLARSVKDEHGRPADSAGVAWAGRDLSGAGNPLHTFDGDDGLMTAQIAQARELLLQGALTEAGFVEALRAQRLFVPVLATRAEEGQRLASPEAPVGDKQADIALISLTSSSGRRTMPIFTSVQALTQWHPEARPVAAETERVMLAALDEGAELVVLDPGSEVDFVIRRPAMTALAQGVCWTPSYDDPEIAAELEGILDYCPGVQRLIVTAGTGVGTVSAAGTAIAGGGAGPELRIVVVTEPGLDEVDVRIAVASVRASLTELELLRERADSVELTAGSA